MTASSNGHKPRPLYIKTPLLYSAPLSKRCGHNIFLKLEALQPSGSFKFRGVSSTIQAHIARTESSKPVHVISSSGGNAGLAAATAARTLGLPCTVFVPDLTPASIVALLEAEGAEVVQGGAAWDRCDESARRKAAEIEAASPGGSFYVHPFEGEDLLQGHSTMMGEIYEQLAQLDEASGDKRPDCVVSSVGGGGLLAGLLLGANAHGGRKPHMLAVQCFGADAYSQSYRSGSLVTLPAITSKATSMGALTPSTRSLSLAEEYAQGAAFSTLTVSDSLAAYAAWQFAKDHRLLIELACAASAVPAYFEQILGSAVAKGPADRPQNIVLVICGGSKISAQALEEWRRDLPTVEAAFKDSRYEFV